MKIRCAFMISTALVSMTALGTTPTYHHTIQPIPKSIRERMVGDSWHKGCPVSLSDLSYLTVSFWGYDAKPHTGHIIVNHQVANETADIFQDLFNSRFPIERMTLPIDTKDSPSENNTHGFDCYLDPTRPKDFSLHAFGLAIDINPRYNPLIASPGKAFPANGQKYLDRSLQHLGMVKVNGPAFNTFIRHGWTWGGFVRHKDYMHFRKLITSYYRVDTMKYIPPQKRIKGLPNF